MSTVFIDKEYKYHVALLKLITEARADGIVLTIDAEPRLPLAMGHFDMRPAARYSRDAKATKLWMLNIEGPDDIVAAPSFMDAIRVRDEFNEYWRVYNAIQVKHGHNPEYMPTLRAVIQEWDGTEDHHNESVSAYWGDYVGFGGVAIQALKERL